MRSDAVYLAATAHCGGPWLRMPNSAVRQGRGPVPRILISYDICVTLALSCLCNGCSQSRIPQADTGSPVSAVWFRWRTGSVLQRILAGGGTRENWIGYKTKHCMGCRVGDSVRAAGCLFGDTKFIVSSQLARSVFDDAARTWVWPSLGFFSLCTGSV